jgi:hypothetical protein
MAPREERDDRHLNRVGLPLDGLLDIFLQLLNLRVRLHKGSVAEPGEIVNERAGSIRGFPLSRIGGRVPPFFKEGVL